MPDIQREALEMIASKLARIFNGDNNYADSYHDIGGYSKLAENDLSQQVMAQPIAPEMAQAPSLRYVRSALPTLGQNNC